MMYAAANPLLAPENEELKIPLLLPSPSSATRLPCVTVASTSLEKGSEGLELTSGDPPSGDVYISVCDAAAASARSKCPECQACSLEAEAEEQLRPHPWFNWNLFALVASHIVSLWFVYLALLIIDNSRVAYVVCGAVWILSIIATVKPLLAFANQNAFYAPMYHHPALDVLLLCFVFALQWGALTCFLFLVTSSIA